jgi:hypothetical protein
MTNDTYSIIYNDNKIRNLFFGLIFDGIVMMSFTIPLIGEFSDVIWAPISGFFMMWMYKGFLGKIGGTVSFLEEILLFSDFVPTFTLVWIYKYLIKKV